MSNFTYIHASRHINFLVTISAHPCYLSCPFNTSPEHSITRKITSKLLSMAYMAQWNLTPASLFRIISCQIFLSCMPASVAFFLFLVSHTCYSPSISPYPPALKLAGFYSFRSQENVTYSNLPDHSTKRLLWSMPSLLYFQSILECLGYHFNHRFN